jgi:hypothetical protein
MEHETAGGYNAKLAYGRTSTRSSYIHTYSPAAQQSTSQKKVLPSLPGVTVVQEEHRPVSFRHCVCDTEIAERADGICVSLPRKLGTPQLGRAYTMTGLARNRET